MMGPDFVEVVLVIESGDIHGMTERLAARDLRRGVLVA